MIVDMRHIVFKTPPEKFPILRESASKVAADGVGASLAIKNPLVRHKTPTSEDITPLGFDALLPFII